MKSEIVSLWRAADARARKAENQLIADALEYSRGSGPDVPALRFEEVCLLREHANLLLRQVMFASEPRPAPPHSE